MSSYSKQSSNSFQKPTICLKVPQAQSKSKERSIKSSELNKDHINANHLQSATSDSQLNEKGSLPGRYPVTSTDKVSLSSENQEQGNRKSSNFANQPTSENSSQNSFKNIASTPTLRAKTLKSSKILGGTPSNKYPHCNTNNSNIKWRRNNFPLFYGGYPSPGRINVPSNIPYFGRGYPTDANLYFPSGICPPHYSPAHHPHIRQHHLAQQRFLALSPVAQSHQYQKYLTLNHISNLKRSRSAHGSFRSKVSSSICNKQGANR